VFALRAALTGPQVAEPAAVHHPDLATDNPATALDPTRVASGTYWWRRAPVLTLVVLSLSGAGA
jgi:hypothetical protein